MSILASSFRWSFSQWETYNQCPAKWKFKSVLKLPGLPPGPAATRGLEIHDSVEHYILSPGRAADTLHHAVKPKYIPVLDEFKNHGNGDRHTELKLAFTKDWGLVQGITGELTWCVMVLDAARVGDGWKKTEPCVVRVGEWKSGKPKDTHGDQRKLYALGALLKWPFADSVEVTTYYLEDTGPPQRLTASKSAEDKLKDLWQGRVEQMQGDSFCAPKPSMACNWCDYAKKKGGPCAFGS
jgi:hypothetical protein